jgi:alkyl hydroperoxide reductase subunit AhpC
MSVQLGNTAPDFTAETTEGKIRFHEWMGKSWAVLFSHPKDFTPVCTTELGYMSKIKPEFEKRGVKVIALSVDPVDAHKKWIGDIEETQSCTINFPLIADTDASIANAYGMIHPEAEAKLTVRSVYIIDAQKKVRAMIQYPPSTGRDFNEILRVIDSLQLTDNHKVATPVNWKNGDDVVIVPSLSDEEAKPRFPKGWRALRPYLRMTPQPNK